MNVPSVEERKPWACPCGSSSLEVIRSERDEDNFPMRLRKCSNCGEHKAFREYVISKNEFYASAHSMTVRARTAYHRVTRECSHCGHRYRGGRFSRHVLSEQHNAALSKRITAKDRATNRHRSFRNYWKERGFEQVEPAPVRNQYRNTRRNEESAA